MFSNIGWGEFLLVVLVALFLYAAVVYFLYYRSSSDGASNELVGKTDPQPVQSVPDNLLGRTHEQKTSLLNGHKNGSTPQSCEACGHVPGTPVKRARGVNSYGEPIGVSLPTDFAAPVPSAEAPLTTEFESVEGSIDLASLTNALEKVTMVGQSVESGAPEEILAAEKADALSLFANDDLLNSELASQLALHLDDTAPTDGYSAVATLSNLKAA